MFSQYLITRCLDQRQGFHYRDIYFEMVCLHRHMDTHKVKQEIPPRIAGAGLIIGGEIETTLKLSCAKASRIGYMELCTTQYDFFSIFCQNEFP